MISCSVCLEYSPAATWPDNGSHVTQSMKILGCSCRVERQSPFRGRKLLCFGEVKDSAARKFGSHN